MPPETEAGATHPDIGDIRIQDVVGIKEQSPFERLIAAQSFWVTVALVIICLVLIFLVPQASAFATPDNIFNITRNFAFIGIMAIGMVAVIVTGGIDLSVGSLMGLVGVCSGLLLQGGFPWWVGIGGGLLAGIAGGRRERCAHCLCRAVAVRGDPRHAFVRPIPGGGALAEPDDL